jgi:hypothetical protein
MAFLLIRRERRRDAADVARVRAAAASSSGSLADASLTRSQAEIASMATAGTAMVTLRTRRESQEVVRAPEPESRRDAVHDDRSVAQYPTPGTMNFEKVGRDMCVDADGVCASRSARIACRRVGARRRAVAPTRCHRAQPTYQARRWPDTSADADVDDDDVCVC